MSDSNTKVVYSNPVGLPLDQTYNPTSENAQSGKAIAPIFANALKGSASGAMSVMVNDVSPIEHDLSINISRTVTTEERLGTIGSQALAPGTMEFSTPFEVKAYDTVKISSAINVNDTSIPSLTLYLLNTSQTAIGSVTILVNTNQTESATTTVYDPSGANDYTITHIAISASVSGIFSVIDVSRITTTEGTLEGVIISQPHKNLFNATAEDFKNGALVGTGRKVWFELMPNTIYTLSSNAPGTSAESNIWFNGTSGSRHGVYNGKSRTVTTDATGAVYVLVRENQLDSIFANNYIQLEVGSVATEYEPYIEPATAAANAEGKVNGLTSVSPNMTLVSDTDGVVINLEYNRDINTAFAELTQAIISMGGNV